MLKSLSIRNFALIDNVELSFEKGLTVITGETGSGKSILLGALNLLLGSRADFSVIRDEEQKTIVEGHWNIEKYNLSPFFVENELEYDAYCIIRREILPKGKSRAFINDTPVSLTLLKELTDRLIQINSQHQTLQLKDKLFQLSILDVLGECTDDLKIYREAFSQLKLKEKEVLHLENELSEQFKQQDYIQFQLEELEKLEIDKTDFESLQIELSRAENAEALLSNFQESSELLDHEGGIITQVKRLQQLIRKSSEYDNSTEAWSDRINSLLIELNDISAELANYAEDISVNPSRLDWLIEKMDGFQRILKKHNKTNQAELIAFYEELSGQTTSYTELEERLSVAKKEVGKYKQEANSLAQKLSDKRKKSVQFIVDQLRTLLNELKLDDSAIEFKFSLKPELDRNGLDTVDLCFSPNKGIAAQPIEKSASGGELSRFMLAVMTLYSSKKQLPTLIFDEIDTGVSGDVAGRIGLLLRKMGQSRQLMAITHLPQVAASGHSHLSVRKSEEDGRTVTEVVPLNVDRRREEIARLMSGKELTAAAIDNANELMKSHEL